MATTSPETLIRVRAGHSTSQAPERGTVHATLALEGPKAPPVLQGVEAGAARLVASIETLHDPAAGPLTWFSVAQLRTSARRPWNEQGKQLPLVHSAQVGFAVKFSDFRALGDWCSAAVDTDGFTIGWIEWALTEKHRLEVEDATRRRAVRNARDRAQSYADALELGPVSVRQIADLGLLGSDRGGHAGDTMMAASRGGALEKGVGDLISPEDIVIKAEVEAEFVVGGRGAGE